MMALRCRRAHDCASRAVGSLRRFATAFKPRGTRGTCDGGRRPGCNPAVCGLVASHHEWSTSLPKRVASSLGRRGFQGVHPTGSCIKGARVRRQGMKLLRREQGESTNPRKENAPDPPPPNPATMMWRSCARGRRRAHREHRQETRRTEQHRGARQQASSRAGPGGAGNRIDRLDAGTMRAGPGPAPVSLAIRITATPRAHRNPSALTRGGRTRAGPGQAARYACIVANGKIFVQIFS